MARRQEALAPPEHSPTARRFIDVVRAHTGSVQNRYEAGMSDGRYTINDPGQMIPMDEVLFEKIESSQPFYGTVPLSAHTILIKFQGHTMIGIRYHEGEGFDLLQDEQNIHPIEDIPEETVDRTLDALAKAEQLGRMLPA